MTERRKLTTLDKLKIVVAQARCPVCGEKLGELEGLDFDHVLALALGGTDTIDNLRAIHRSPCHARKTNGTAATSAGSDKHLIAKMKRVRADPAGGEEFRRKLLAPAFLPADHQDTGERRAKRAWPKRSFAKRRKPQ